MLPHLNSISGHALIARGRPIGEGSASQVLNHAMMRLPAGDEPHDYHHSLFTSTGVLSLSQTNARTVMFTVSVLRTTSAKHVLCHNLHLKPC